MKILRRYAGWLHTRWPAGTVEPLPEIAENGLTSIPGVAIVGDLTGIPLLKFAADSGARAVATLFDGASFEPAGDVLEPDGDGGAVLDLVIIGAGVAGIAAALEARRRRLTFRVYESTETFSTLVNIPVRKPIFTYPTEMKPRGDLQFHEISKVKEGLLDDLRQQVAEAGIEPVVTPVEGVERKGEVLQVDLEGGGAVFARRVIIAIGRSGNHRRLKIPGEESGKVFSRLHDPALFEGQQVLVVGGGDSACEAAIALADGGSHVTLVHRGSELSRPRPENVGSVEKRRGVGRGKVDLRLSTTVVRIGEKNVTLESDVGEESLSNDTVFALIGREAPLDFFRRSGIPIRGEWRPRSWFSLVAVLILFTFIYHWKKPGVWLPIGDWWQEGGGFPYAVPGWWSSLGGAFAERGTLLSTLKVSVGEPGFWYSLLFTAVILIFGIRRIARRKTPYVKLQTWTLFAIQALPLFLLPYLLLPWLGSNGAFDGGWGEWVADQLFPIVDSGHGREYWRAFGLILAWPLFFWNVFSDQPLTGWLVISFLQTFLLIPWLVRRWGKGAYCGWICSCGALAETLGDAHREKMPHGPVFNRLNMIGQVFLAIAFLILSVRVISWLLPQTTIGEMSASLYRSMLDGVPGLNYVWFVDLFFAGIIGVGLYWHFSGRVWCRFACPLAALMNIYGRFSRFRIFSEKEKCISCNVCTSVCHQGIDVMNFANRGLAMADPQCVRCSACIGSCPTGVLSFGALSGDGKEVRLDRLEAKSPALAVER